MTLGQMRLGVDLVTGLVIATVAVALALLTWRVTGYDEGRAQVAIAAEPPADRSLDVSPILAFAPFGSSAALSAPAGDASSLGLTLRGVVLAQPRSASSALIGASGGAPTAYGVGQTIVGGAVVETIEMDHVVLRLGDRLERLAFPDPAGGSAAATAGDVAALRAQVQPGAAPAPPSPPPPAAAPAATSPTEDIRRQVTANPQALLDSLGAQRGAGGYTIGPDASPQLLATGLQPGDVVERVNGQAVGDAQSDRRLFDQALVEGQARVEVVRGGRRLTLSFPLR